MNINMNDMYQAFCDMDMEIHFNNNTAQKAYEKSMNTYYNTYINFKVFENTTNKLLMKDPQCRLWDFLYEMTIEYCIKHPEVQFIPDD